MRAAEPHLAPNLSQACEQGLWVRHRLNCPRGKEHPPMPLALSEPPKALLSLGLRLPASDQDKVNCFP